MRKIFYVKGDFQTVMVFPVFRENDTVWVQMPFDNKLLPLLKVPINLLIWIDDFGHSKIAGKAIIDSYLKESPSKFGIFNRVTGENVLGEEYDSPIEAGKYLVHILLGGWNYVTGDKETPYKDFQECEIRLIK